MRILTTLFIIGMLSWIYAGNTAASENIRVLLSDRQTTVTLSSPSGLLIAGNASGRQGKKITIHSRSIGTSPMRISAGSGFIQVNKKQYRGWIELQKTKTGRLRIINDLNIEEYLKGVIASEIPHTWDPEALKAQAVASRTYALYQKRMAGTRPYHVLATVKNQVYNGILSERPNAITAVNDTRGLFLVYQGDVIPAFYHASCGGHTENAAELWNMDEPYLQGVSCGCQNISPLGVWKKTLKLSTVKNALKQKGYGVHAMEGMTINSRTNAGRARTIALDVVDTTVHVSGAVLRTALGNTVIPSVFFDLELAENEAVFRGRGSGHGVGLCQWGAQEMASRGHNYFVILSHYYPGTNLARME
ncbi:MAG: SpoIID/LytB domain-containing protein [Nitrospirota bacterium]